MQIGNINSINHNSFKGQIVPFSKSESNLQNKSDEFIEKSSVNPEYYQALYGINETSDLEYKEKFDEIYKKVLQNMTKSKNFLLSEIEKSLNPIDSNIIEMDIPQEFMDEKIIKMLSGSLDFKSDLEILNFIKELSGEPKKQIMQEISKCIQDNSQDISIEAKNRTSKIFRLSETQTGYDFSDIEEKSHLIEVIDEFVFQFGDDIDEDELYEDILNTCNKEGKINYKFIEDTLNIIYESNFLADFNKTFETLKRLYSKDVKNSDKVKQMLNQLNHTIFQLDDKNNDFEEFANLCFDENLKFSEERKNILLELISEVDSWIDKQIHCASDYKKFPLCMNIAKETINDYFSEFVDNKIEISNNISPAEYVNQRLGEVIVI